MATLYDAYGRPIRLGDLKKEFAAPTLAGVRTIWDDTIASGLTPQRLATLLRAAAEGDHFEYLTLAEEMEEREIHYATELRKRKLAVTRLPIGVEAASDSEHDKMLAEEIRKLTRRPGFRGLLSSMMDAVAKGFSAAEILWNTTGRLWMPERYEWRDPRFFQFDRVTRRELRLRDEQDLVDGLPLPPYKFIVHLPQIKCGIPIRNGLARLAAWSFMCKGYTVKDWLAFAEIYGMPLRLGKYHAGATEQEIDILKIAVANLGSDAAAVFPQGMDIQFPESQKYGSINVYETLAKYIDGQITKGILGQGATTEGTPGKLGNEGAQQEVRQDIRDDDAEQLEETLNRDLVKAFIDLNFGPQENYPSVTLREPDAEDVAVFSEAVSKLVDRGLKVRSREVRDRMGLSDPEEGDEVMAAAGPQDLAPIAVNSRLGRALNTLQRFTPEQQAIEDLADQVVTLAGAEREKSAGLILEALRSVGSYEEAVLALLGLYPQIPSVELEELLQQTLFAGEMFGRQEGGKV